MEGRVGGSLNGREGGRRANGSPNSTPLTFFVLDCAIWQPLPHFKYTCRINAMFRANLQAHELNRTQHL